MAPAGGAARARLGDLEGACMRRDAAFGAGYCAALAAAHAAVRSLATEAEGGAGGGAVPSEPGEPAGRPVEPAGPVGKRARQSSVGDKHAPLQVELEQ